MKYVLGVKKLKVFIFLAGVFLFNMALCWAEDSRNTDYIFYKASRLYEETKYDEAALEYSRIRKEGFESGNLYYNLGNCYFKKGVLGKAILNYERAKRLIPRDRDLESNYKYAQSLIKGEINKPARIWIVRVINNFFDQFTVDGISMLLSVIYILLILTIGASRIFKVSKIKFAVGLSALTAFFVISAVFLYGRISFLEKEGIIIEEKVDAKFEPFDKAVKHFTFHEGMKVFVISSKDEWYKVKRLDGRAGWIKKSQLEII